MVNGHTAKEFISVFGGMFGNAINREAKAIDPNSGNRSSREVCAQDGHPSMDGTKGLVEWGQA
jgi:hypothetical protein